MDNIYDLIMEKQMVYLFSDKYTENECSHELLHATAVIVNLYYQDTLPFYFKYLDNVPEEINLYIVSSDLNVLHKARKYFQKRANTFIMSKNNRGRDISALFVTAREIIPQYRYICFIHDKKPNFDYVSSDIEFWVRNLWDNTLKSKQYIFNVLNFLESHENMGLLAPPKPIGWNMPDWYLNAWHGDFEIVRRLCNEFDLRCDLNVDKPVMTLGTVFWGKTKILSKLLAKKWKYEDFPAEPMPIDGTISHGLERVLAYAAQDANLFTGTVMCESYASALYIKVQEMMRKTYELLWDNFYIRQIDQLINYDRQKRQTSDAFVKHKNVYLYGAGFYGHRFLKMLQAWGYSPKGFLVSDGCRHPDSVEGYPVWELRELNSRNVMVIITAAYNKHRDMQESLEQYGITDYFIAC